MVCVAGITAGVSGTRRLLCGDSNVAGKWSLCFGTSHIQKTLHSGWKEKIAFPISQIDDQVKHIFREHNQEAGHWANWGAAGQRQKFIDKGNNTEKWKMVRGF